MTISRTDHVICATPPGLLRAERSMGFRLTRYAVIFAAACHAGQDLGSNPDGNGHQVHGPGELIAYTRGIGLDGTKGLYVARRDASGELVLHSAHNLATPSWSPDGTRIAFTADGLLYLIDRDGQNLASLVPGGVSGVLEPKWSPDGTKIMFSTTSTIYTVSATGGAATVLATDAASPAWSPDGSQIAYRSGTGATAALWVINADATDPHKVVGPLDQFFTPGTAWSPDGSVIAFCLGDFESDIWTIAPTGGTPKQITTAAGGEYNLSYSPDGSKIAMYHFADTNNFGVYELTLATGILAPLIPKSEDPAYQP